MPGLDTFTPHGESLRRDPPPAAAEEAAAAEAPVEDQFERLWTILDTLVPPDETTTVEDTGGHSYELPKILSARQQIGVAQHLKALWKELKKDGQFEALQTAWSAREPGDLFAGALDAMSESALDHLDAAFASAFGPALQAAREQLQTPTGRASDLFPVEAVVGSLLPFASRLLRRGGDVITRLSTAAAKLA